MIGSIKITQYSLTFLEQNPQFKIYFSFENTFGLYHNEAHRVCPTPREKFCHLNFKFLHVLRLYFLC